MPATFELIGEKALMDSLKDKSKGVVDAVEKAVNLATLMVHGDIVESIQQGSKSGVKYSVGGKSGQRSAKGEAPATDTGHLVSNIVPKISKQNNQVSGSITSRADYSYALEFGTSDMAKRPFMRPALNKNKKKIRSMIAKAMNMGLEK